MEAELKIDTIEKMAAWMEETDGNTAADHLEWLRAMGCEDYRGPEHWWQMREALRGNKAPGGRVQWAAHNDEFEKFHIRVSATDPMKIAYTPSDEYGRADRQIRTSPGRFIKKFWPDSSDEYIREIVDAHRAQYGPPTVHFAFDAHDITQVYKDGPNSCMGKEGWASPGVAVYDGPDTVLALLKKGERITARTVCRVDTQPMQYTRLYGDDCLLAASLMKLGFVSGSLNGARLRYAEDDGRILCPYIDGVDCAHEADDFLVLGNGELNTHNTTGYTDDADDDNQRNCDDCGDSYHYMDMATDVGDNYICTDCCNDHYQEVVIDVRHDTYAWVHENNCVHIDGRGWYYDDDEVLTELGFVTDADDEWRHLDDVTYVEEYDTYYDNDLVCNAYGRDDPCLLEDCVKDEDGDWVHKDDAVFVDGVWYHTDYAPEPTEKEEA